MCLDGRLKRGQYPKKVKRIGYKVAIKANVNGEVHYIAPVMGTEYKKRNIVEDSVDLKIPGYGEKYEAGFHIFRTLGGAVKWKKTAFYNPFYGCFSNRSIVILKVSYKEVVAEGIQIIGGVFHHKGKIFYRVDVAKDMKIIKEVKHETYRQTKGNN